MMSPMPCAAGTGQASSSKASLASAAVQKLILRLLPAALQPLGAVIVQTQEQELSKARLEVYRGEGLALPLPMLYNNPFKSMQQGCCHLSP